MSNDFRTGFQIGLFVYIGAHILGVLLGLLIIVAMLCLGALLAA